MKLNYNKFFGYLGYSLGFILLLVFISHINFYFIEKVNESYWMYPWGIFAVFMYFPIGIYLGMPQFLKEIKKTGKWRVDFYKITLLALPMTFISLYWLFPFSFPIPTILTYTKPVFNFGIIIAGYFIISSFNKD